MARHVVSQIFANHAHQVVTGITHVILRLVLIPLHAHVAVDGIKALRDGATAIDVGFFGDHDFHIAAPVAGFIGGTGAAHTAADDQNVAVFKNCFETHQ